MSEKDDKTDNLNLPSRAAIESFFTMLILSNSDKNYNKYRVYISLLDV